MRAGLKVRTGLVSSAFTLPSPWQSHLQDKVWVEIDKRQAAGKDNGGSVRDVGSLNTLISESVERLSELINNGLNHT